MKIKISLALVVAFLAPLAANAFSIVPAKCQGAAGCGICDIALAFTNAADIIAGLLGAVALLFFIIGGFFLILSSGNEQRIETGKKILVGTVTGLAIVFLAWFAVNFVVRVAYQGSNPASSTGGISTGSADNNVTVFGIKTSWWSLPACDPGLTKCAGKYVGEACGSVGDCAGGGKSGCTCFRVQDDKGDDLTCSGTEADAGNVSSTSYKTKQCYCATPCAQANYNKTINPDGKEFVCITQEVLDVQNAAHIGTYTKYDNISCADTTMVCAKK